MTGETTSTPAASNPQGWGPFVVPGLDWRESERSVATVSAIQGLRRSQEKLPSKVRSVRRPTLAHQNLVVW